MDSNPLKAAILRMEGTNNEMEAYRSFQEVGFKPDYVHIKEIELGKRDLEDYDAIFIPGGFSAGDYVRAGIIFASRLMKSAGKKIENIEEDGKPIIGTCNGFQVLVESGMLSAKNGSKDMALSVNKSGTFECRHVYIKYMGGNKIFDTLFRKNEVFEVPVAHKEGNLIISEDVDIQGELIDSGRALFRYTDQYGEFMDYPWNPNGSYGNIAGISSVKGNVLGLMPHPERIFYEYQMSTYGKIKNMEPMGKKFFKSIYLYASSI